jgi:hypothetical protein
MMRSGGIAGHLSQVALKTNFRRRIPPLEVWWKRWLLRCAAFAILPLLVQIRGRLSAVAEVF